jgi:hypothetical protein
MARLQHTNCSAALLQVIGASKQPIKATLKQLADAVSKIAQSTFGPHQVFHTVRRLKGEKRVAYTSLTVRDGVEGLRS